MSSGPQPTPENSPHGRGGSFYDEQEVFDRYQLHREWSLAPNAVMEEPALLAELGKVCGLRILDLGCGDAAVARLVLDAGAESYLGIDGSANMVRAAQATLPSSGAAVHQCDIEEFRAAPASFDLVISRMALHYIDDVTQLFHSCHDWLSPGGRIVFTVTHPVITSHDARAGTDEPRQHWVVDDYFVSGLREQEWLGGRARWYHRTIEEYVRHLHAAGFALANLRECAPVRELFDDETEFQRRQRVPLILLLAAARG